MQFLVRTSGEVSNIQDKTYIVSAKSESEASAIAMQNFKKEFNCIQIDTETQSYARTKRAVIAGIFMLIAIVISFFNFTYEENFLLFFSIERSFSFAPSMISCLFAIAFYSSYVIRFKGIARAVGTAIDIAFCVLSVLLLSSVFELILTSEELTFLYFIKLPSPYMILTFAIIFSLFGVKLLSALCMAFIALVAVSNILVANEAMKIWGVVYVLSAFMGILLYLSIEPAVLESFPKIRESFSNIFKATKKEFAEGRAEADALIGTINNKISSNTSKDNNTSNSSNNNKQ